MGYCSGTLAAVLDPVTAAWISAVQIAGGSVSNARRPLVDNLIKGLKTDGVWTLFDRLWILAGENQSSSLIDFVALKQIKVAGTVPFVADRGWTGVDGNANPNYLDTGY